MTLDHGVWIYARVCSLFKTGRDLVKLGVRTKLSGMTAVLDRSLHDGRLSRIAETGELC
jgi:hypothetical protein